MELDLPYYSDKCLTRIEGKSNRKDFPKQTKTSKQLGELIHSDVCGPVNRQNTHIHKLKKNIFRLLWMIFQIVVVVNLLKYKDEEEDYFVAYINEVETQYGTSVKRLLIYNEEVT